MFTDNNILIVVAHPDDEWWGLGGTLLRLHEEFNSKLHICFVTDGQRRSKNEHNRRLDSIRVCLRDLGIEKPKSLGFKDMSVYKYIEDIVLELDKIIKQCSPSVIFTHFPYDFHQDHKAINECVMSATRVDSSISILFMETPFKSNFLANYYIDISNYIDKKIKIWTEDYAKESWRRPEYSSEYLRCMASFRGLGAGVDFAEAFILLKGVLK